MRCPNCDQWNRASLPRCIRCGTALTTDEPVTPSWRSELSDKGPGKAYIRVDEDGDMSVTPDDRDVLAAEMSELKARKDAGTVRQRRLRQERGISTPPAPMTPEIQEIEDIAWENREAKETIFPEHETTRRVRINALPREDGAPDAKAAQQAAHARTAQGSRTVLNPTQWHDSRTYDPLVNELQQAHVFKQPPSLNELPVTPSRKKGLRRVIRWLSTLLILGVIGLGAYMGILTYQHYRNTNAEKNRAIVTASIMNDLAAHTILIPGEEGQSIYIKELATSYPVTGGFANIEIADHTWYTDMEAITDEIMTVTLTPYMKTTSGRQKPLDLITYDISIPLSPIELVTPESLRTEVTTAMYSMLFNIRPNSTVYINGENVSDTVSEEGQLTYNATVQPIGDNVYNISVRSPYCRDNSMQVVLYREVQEIPLDLAATTYTSTSLSRLQISATTLPGAEIDVLSPHSDLKITTLDTTGEFTFYAVFDKIGYNTISIEASYPGKKTSRVDYTIYYLPNPDVYTPKAWPLNTASDYAELLGNITYRAENTQIYVAVGKIDHFVSSSPQMAVMYCSDDGLSQPVLLENQTKTTWKVGEYYNIYADAYGTYNSMPWLIARYTY